MWSHLTRRPRSRPALTGAVLLAVALTAGLTGCMADDSGGGDGADTTGLDLPEGATMPFDLYLGQDVTYILYAQRQVRARCMADAGFTQLLDTGDRLGENMFGDMSEPRYPPRTEEEARANGFHGPVPGAPASVLSFDAGFDQAYDACFAEAEEAVGASPGLIAGYVEQLGNTINRELWNELEAVEAEYADEVLDCLAGHGFEPDSREAYREDPDPHERFGIPLGDYHPTAPEWEPDRTPGTVAVGPPDPDRTYQPTEEESRLAVAMVQCRTETGFFAEIDEVNLTAQQDIVEDHAVEFAELNPQIEQAAMRAAEVLDR
ncbi:hypothetical protein [Streptomyces specialis]|uniref:hypothetical protein n=1 Tax=Streptomyces specialis TaxID=498367 RepID=UPI00073F05D2|nr:hypothetical protein [Streptomyces specialis]